MSSKNSNFSTNPNESNSQKNKGAKDKDKRDKRNKPDTTPSPNDNQGRNKTQKITTSPESSHPTSTPQTLYSHALKNDISRINSQLDQMASSATSCSLSSPACDGAMALRPLTPGLLATPPPGSAGLPSLPCSMDTPRTNSSDPVSKTIIPPDVFMDHFEQMISGELNELGIKDKTMLRAIDKLIKLNNAVLDSYFDAKFKELKNNVESQISETTAHYIQALNEKDKALNDLTNQVKVLQDQNSLLEAKLSSAVDSISTLDKKLDDQDMYERRDTLVFSG